MRSATTPQACSACAASPSRAHHALAGGGERRFGGAAPRGRRRRRRISASVSTSAARRWAASATSSASRAAAWRVAIAAGAAASAACSARASAARAVSSVTRPAASAIAHVPVGALGGEGAAAMAPAGGGAGKGVALGTGFGLAGAGGGEGGAGLLHGDAGGGRVGEPRHRPGRVAVRVGGFLGVGGEPRLLGVERRCGGPRHWRRGRPGRRRGAGTLQALLGVAAGGAGVLLGGVRLPFRRLGPICAICPRSLSDFDAAPRSAASASVRAVRSQASASAWALRSVASASASGGALGGLGVLARRPGGGGRVDGLRQPACAARPAGCAAAAARRRLSACRPG